MVSVNPKMPVCIRKKVDAAHLVGLERHCVSRTPSAKLDVATNDSRIGISGTFRLPSRKAQLSLLFVYTAGIVTAWLVSQPIFSVLK